MNHIEDTLFVVTESTFRWRDRLRVLFGWRLNITNAIDCEHAPGATAPQETRTFYAAPSWWPQRRHKGGWASSIVGIDIANPDGDRSAMVTR